jgi:hypothetical protein
VTTLYRRLYTRSKRTGGTEPPAKSSTQSKTREGDPAFAGSMAQTRLGEGRPRASVHRRCVDNKRIMRVVSTRGLREIAVFGSGLRRTAAGNAPSVDCR